MSGLGSLRYHLNVEVAGAAALRLERLRSERALRAPGAWKDPLLAPPLHCAPRLKELISRHYLAGRYANGHRKVAWVTSGAPMECLHALGYFVLYPENHAVVCATRRMSEELCSAAESSGYSRDLCSYARTDIGSVLSGKTPVGKLPRPDLLICCDNICQTVVGWYQVLAHHFRVPLVIVDTPFVYTELEEHAVAYVKKQIEHVVEVAERVAGKSLGGAALRTTSALTRDAMELWNTILHRGAHKPAPLSAFDQFIHMAPIVEMRGKPEAVEYYRIMLAELDERVARGIGTVKDERIRLLWDNLPIWPRLRWMSVKLAERGAALVASTYTNAWAEVAPLVDPDNPIECAAKIYLLGLLNRGTGYKLQCMKKMVEEYSIDGVILHSDRSCKPYSLGQMDQRERMAKEAGVPAILLEADHSDPRLFSEEQAATRLAAFLEVLEA